MGCLPFFHKYSDWTQVAGKCEEQQVCSKCGDTKKRTAHKMTDWAQVPGQCKRERHCQNPWCSVTEEQQTSHKFGDWEYYEDGCCTQKRVCTVCGEVEYREKCPDRKEEIPVEGKCRVIMCCPRCGLEEIHSVEHTWDAKVVAYRTAMSGSIMKKTAALNKMKTSGATAEEIEAARAELEADRKKMQEMPSDVMGRVCTKCGVMQRVGKR